MKLKIGMVVWECTVFEGKIEWDEWVLRSIRRPRRKIAEMLGGIIPKQHAFFVRKTRSTWVKKSKKHFDYGWAERIDDLDRNATAIDSGQLPTGLYSTRWRAAAGLVNSEKAALKRVMLREGDDWDTERDECIQECRIDLAAAKRNLTRCRRGIHPGGYRNKGAKP